MLSSIESIKINPFLSHKPKVEDPLSNENLLASMNANFKAIAETQKYISQMKEKYLTIQYNRIGKENEWFCSEFLPNDPSYNVNLTIEKGVANWGEIVYCKNEAGVVNIGRILPYADNDKLALSVNHNHIVDIDINEVVGRIVNYSVQMYYGGV